MFYRYFAYFTAVGTTFYTTVKVNVSDIYASTDSVHVLDLIGSDYTAFGMDCTSYLCNVSSDMYEYDTSTRLIRVQFIVQPSLEIATCLVYLSLVATTTSSTQRAYCIDHRTA